MLTFLQIIMTVLLSLAVGLLMGIVGGGGGGIYVIIMMVFLHQNVTTATGTALILSTITLSGAAFQYLRKKQVRKDYFIALSLIGIAGTLLGSLLMRFINERILTIAIVCVFVLSGLSSLVKMKLKKADGQDMLCASKRMPIVVPLGLVSGLITGALALSGGTVLSSFLVGLLDFSPYMAVGTTTLITLVLNLTGAIFHFSSAHLSLSVLLVFGTGSAVGSIFGAKLATKISRKVLAAVLAAAAILSGIYLAIK